MAIMRVAQLTLTFKSEFEGLSANSENRHVKMKRLKGQFIPCTEEQSYNRTCRKRRKIQVQLGHQ